MADLPVMLKVAGRRCVIVGGGATAARRAAALIAAEAQITIVAPSIDAAILDLDAAVLNRPFEPDDLDDAFLVVIATDDKTVNEQIASLAKSAGVLVNRCDRGDLGDFSVPAHRRDGPITLAVHTDGAAPTAAAQIRDELAQKLDPDWTRLLEIAAPYRRQLQATITDGVERRKKLTRITGPQALKLLKMEGPQAVEALCRQWCGSTDADKPTPAT